MHVIYMWLMVQNNLNKYYGGTFQRELSLLPEVIRDHFTKEGTLELGFKPRVGVCKAGKDGKVFPSREKSICKCLKL